MLNNYRKNKSGTNRINMARARTDYKAEVRKFKLELDEAKKEMSCR